MSVRLQMELESQLELKLNWTSFVSGNSNHFLISSSFQISVIRFNLTYRPKRLIECYSAHLKPKVFAWKLPSLCNRHDHCLSFVLIVRKPIGCRIILSSPGNPSCDWSSIAQNFGLFLETPSSYPPVHFSRSSIIRLMLFFEVRTQRNILYVVSDLHT